MKTKTESITRHHIVSRIAQDSESSVRDAGVVFDCIIDQITASLADGNEVLLSGFGKFVVQDKTARMGRNPRTNQPVPISARRVMRFRPSDNLKAILNPGTPGESS